MTVTPGNGLLLLLHRVTFPDITFSEIEEIFVLFVLFNSTVELSEILRLEPSGCSDAETEPNKIRVPKITKIETNRCLFVTISPAKIN